MRPKLNCGLALVVLTLAFVCAADAGESASNQPALFPFTVNGKGGYIDRQGRVVVAPRYDEVRPFSEGLAAVSIDGEWGFIDGSGTVVIAPQYARVGGFSEGLASAFVPAVEDDSGASLPPGFTSSPGRRLHGFIDAKGQMVIPPVFESQSGYPKFSEGLARVKRDGRWEFIDRAGVTVISVQYLSADDFQGGFAVVAREFKGGLRVGYIDKAGKMLPTGWLTSAGPFSEGLAAVSTDARVRPSLDRDGIVFDTFEATSELYAPARYRVINTKGERVFEGTYQRVGEFSEGLAPVLTGGKWGYVDRQGRLAIPARFDCAGAFSEGLALVCSGDERNLIDAAGRVRVKTDYTIFMPFTGGLVRVQACDPAPCRHGYMDKTGRVIWPSSSTEVTGK